MSGVTNAACLGKSACTPSQLGEIAPPGNEHLDDTGTPANEHHNIGHGGHKRTDF